MGELLFFQIKVFYPQHKKTQHVLCQEFEPLIIETYTARFRLLNVQSYLIFLQNLYMIAFSCSIQNTFLTNYNKLNLSKTKRDVLVVYLGHPLHFIISRFYTSLSIKFLFYLIHRIIISCFTWNLLNYIPVFDNLSILVTKYIDYSNFPYLEN